VQKNDQRARRRRLRQLIRAVALEAATSLVLRQPCEAVSRRRAMTSGSNECYGDPPGAPSRAAVSLPDGNGGAIMASTPGRFSKRGTVCSDERAVGHRRSATPVRPLELRAPGRGLRGIDACACCQRRRAGLFNRHQSNGGASVGPSLRVVNECGGAVLAVLERGTQVPPAAAPTRRRNLPTRAENCPAAVDLSPASRYTRERRVLRSEEER
jgi:hypothetical protein